MLSFKESRAAIPAQDIGRARNFYEQKLGLAPGESLSDGSVFYNVGSSRFLVFPSHGKASGDHTQMGLEVDDIAVAVNELKERGVAFEEYDFPGLKTEGGIASIGEEKAAWFKDSEGNVVGLLQRAAVATSSH
ncbi:VOC family protein [bacterium]|nr:MAG: VOC family protein [bacterium]